MIRIGTIVTTDANPLMNVSPIYKRLVKELSALNFPSEKIKLLAVLIISQTEKQYKKYLVHVLKNLSDLDVEKLIADWQKENFTINDQDFTELLTTEEIEALKDLDFEAELDDHPEMFKDGLDNSFYPTKKKDIVYWRRLTAKYLKNYDSFNTYQKLILHFITAQMLVSWESSCIHLGKLILENRMVEYMYGWFSEVWQIYRV